MLAQFSSLDVVRDGEVGLARGGHLVDDLAALARIEADQARVNLRALPLTTLINRADGRAWPWVFRDDTQVQPRTPAFITDDPETEVRAACAGIGFTQTSEYLLRPHVERGALVRVLRRFEPAPWTPEGRALVRTYAARFQPIFKTAFGALSTTDKRSLERILRRLIDSMDEAERMIGPVA
mgnify:CR=1 FL=1